MGDRSAEIGYHDNADDYRRARPTYAESALDWVFEQLMLTSGSACADLGAGTGTLACELVRRGLDVVAVEPVDAMADEIIPGPHLEIRRVRAEATAIPAGSMGAVFSATAWHWFDGPAALREVERILRPEGCLVLLWNLYDESIPWVHDFAEVGYRRRRASVPEARTGQWRSTFSRSPSWQLEHRVFPNPQATSHELLLRRLASSSAIGALDDVARDEARQEAVRILISAGIRPGDRVTLPYDTHVYLGRRMQAE